MAPLQKQWADGPFALISSTRAQSKKGVQGKGSRLIAEEMVIVHNFLLRILNSIYLQCVNVEKSPNPSDVQAFVEYASLWPEIVHEHHGLEETTFFPQIEELAGVPGLMGNNVEQHKLFHDGLDAYEAYLKSVKEGKEKYDGLKFKGIIDSFAPVLREHLSDEIDTLMGLEKYEDKTDWEGWFKALQAEILKKTNDPKLKTTGIPLILTNRDVTFEDGVYAHWPPLPWFVNLLFKWIFIPKHSDWWKFSSCDSSGVPKDLPFV